jgi:hypothetical protein
MISNKKCLNYKIVDHDKIYIFYIKLSPSEFIK